MQSKKTKEAEGPVLFNIPENLAETPLMRQYNSIKAKHPDAILLFRVGDFYETFSTDAIKAAEILGITLTRRANGSASFVELAGFPFHALDTYLPRLVRAGQRVAICEQLEDPKLTKKIVKRGITELVTPGVSLNDNILNHKENNFLACVHLEKRMAGVAFLDISTGEFLAAEGGFDHIDRLLQSFQPKEILFEKGKKQLFQELFGSRFYIYPLDDWAFTPSAAYERLLRQFQTQSLKGFGIQDLPLGIIAAGASLQYLDLTEHDRISHINRLARIEEEKFVWLDKFTIRNLEIFQSLTDGGRALFDILDRTRTPMGSRMFRRWLAMPLKEARPITDRLNGTEFLLAHPDERDSLSLQVKLIGDLERLISKVAVGRISPREVNQIKNALEAVAEVKTLCAQSHEPGLERIAEQLNPCTSIAERILRELVPNPPASIQKGQVIASGVSGELDELRNLAISGKDFLAEIQRREAERTGISSLRISFNNVFGYYIEVRNTHKDKVPDDWIRKQTLVSAERYITDELKHYEEKILGAEDRIFEIENRLFADLVAGVSEYMAPIQLDATLTAHLDCLLSYADVAAENHYVRPVLTEGEELDILQGRHPVIEKQLPPGESYIANDIRLDSTDQQIIIITGPNMAGKSALLRQTALIVLMAQAGSYIPAASARIGLVDKIFTRVGASDNISQGESTFMVEMLEAASILNNLSAKSLVLFDELGRGTSTYDGISIAWAIVEHIHEHPLARAKTLFATHYHELNEMEGSFGRIRNFNVSVKEIGGKIIFLRKLEPGGSAHSFGIHVGKLAGLPPSVIRRANEILLELEGSSRQQTRQKPVKGLGNRREGYQLSIFQLDDPVLKQIRDELKKVDINNLTPMEALNKLNDIKRLSGL